MLCTFLYTPDVSWLSLGIDWLTANLLKSPASSSVYFIIFHYIACSDQMPCGYRQRLSDSKFPQMSSTFLTIIYCISCIWKIHTSCFRVIVRDWVRARFLTSPAPYSISFQIPPPAANPWLGQFHKLLGIWICLS